MIVTQTTDQNQVLKVLVHYKKFCVSLGIIVICLTLFIFIIFPQFQQYGQQTEETKEVQARVNILTNNLSFLSRLNQQDQIARLSTVLAALPDDKDYAGILFAVKNASAKAGVGLGDFTFQVGELSQKSVITKNLPTLQLTLHVLGSPKAVGDFLQELSQTVPLSNVTEIKMGASTAEVIVEFYYKPIPQLKVNYASPLLDISVQKKKSLDDINAWHVNEPNFDIVAPFEGSSSASPFGF